MGIWTQRQVFIVRNTGLLKYFYPIFGGRQSLVANVDIFVIYSRKELFSLLRRKMKVKCKTSLEEEDLHIIYWDDDMKEMVGDMTPAGTFWLVPSGCIPVIRERDETEERNA